MKKVFFIFFHSASKKQCMFLWNFFVSMLESNFSHLESLSVQNNLKLLLFSKGKCFRTWSALCFLLQEFHQCLRWYRASAQSEASDMCFALPQFVKRMDFMLIIDRVALAKQGDNRIGSVRLSVCLGVPRAHYTPRSVISGRLRIIARMGSIGF